MPFAAEEFFVCDYNIKFNKTMIETKTQTIYDSPRVKVVEIKARQVLCASPYDNGIANMTTDGETGI